MIKRFFAPPADSRRGPRPPGGSGLLAWLLGTLVLVALYLVPRLLLYRGLPVTARFGFADMFMHQQNLMRLCLRLTLPEDSPSMLLARQVPEVLAPLEADLWPSGVTHAALPFALLFGPNALLTVQLTNALFSTILVASLYGLGRDLFGPRAGFYAAVLGLLCPVLFAATWYLSLDYPLSAMGLLALWLLVRTQHFTRSLPSLLFGLVLGMGLWVKYTLALFLALPVLVSAGLGLARGPRRRVAGLLALGLLFASGVLLLVQRPDLPALWDRFLLHTHPGVLTASRFVQSPKDAWLSLPTFAALALPYPALLVCLPGLFLWHRGPSRRRALLPLVYFWGGCLVLTLLPNRLERYLLPLYPVLCLGAVHFVDRAFAGRLGRALPAVLALGFAALLVVTQVHPTPWHTRPDPWTLRGAMWFELGMPGLKRLDPLRQDPEHSGCAFGPALRQARRWLDALPPGEPVGLAYLRQNPGRVPDTIHDDFYLLLAQDMTRAGRLLVYGGYAGAMQPQALHAATPHLIVLHLADEDPLASLRAWRSVAELTFRSTCRLSSGKQQPMHLTVRLAQQRR